MRAARKFGGRRRHGISNLVGAVFFVLIVALVLTTLIAMFTVSSGYIGGIHTSNTSAQQAQGTNVSVSGVAFGGELATARANVPVNGSIPSPLFPVTNMNFSGGMQGWYVSTSYPGLVDSAGVTNVLQSNMSDYIELTQLPAINPVTFVLSITNDNPLGSGNDTAKISLLADTYLTSVAWGSCLTPLTCGGWTLYPPVGNNLTVTAVILDQLVPGATAQLSWTADVPATLGNYYDTVVLYWHSGHEPLVTYSDYGTVTVTTTVASPLPSMCPCAPVSVLSPRTAGITPGGLVAGYDGNALTTNSPSGPGSVYVNFEPNFGGQRLPAGQELSAGATFSTSFSLSQADICQLRVTFLSGPCIQPCPSNCYMTASFAASLDQAESVPNLLAYYHVLLVNPAGTVFVVNPDGSDPTTLNHFGPTGWAEQDVQITPGSAFWVPGTYSFEVVVNMTMPSGQPSDLTMHFDDLGLALSLETPILGTGGSVYANGVLPLTFAPAVSYNQAQEVTLGLNMSLSSIPSQTLTDTIAYIYAAAQPVVLRSEATPTVWYEVGSVIFNSTANANVLIQLPQATGFITSSSQLDVKVVAISVGSGLDCLAPPGPPVCTLSVSAYAITTTLNTPQATGQAVFTLTNPQGASSLRLVSLFISGPNGTLPAKPTGGDTNGVATFPLSQWMSAGSTAVIYEDLASQNFLWVPGQVYLVTVVSNTGTSYSASFTAP